MAAASPVDPSKTATYPVVLSDALLGKASKETYTGIRYNHKPDIDPDNTSVTARLKQSNKDGTFNLGLDDNGNKYAYNGVRTTKDGNYVLIFDPARQAFVLHRLDSLFHMNLTRTPSNSDVESLRTQFPQLEVQPSPSTTSNSKDVPKTGTKAASSRTTKTTPRPSAKDDNNTASKPAKTTKPAKASSALRKPATKKTATTQKKAPAPDPSKLMPPPPAPPKPSKKATTTTARSPASDEEEEDDDDDDDDGGLTIEYPGGEPPSRHQVRPPFGSGFAQPPVAALTRRFSDFVKNGEDEGPGNQHAQQRQQPQQEQEDELAFTFEDAIGSEDEEDEEMEDVGDGFKLPSPVDGKQQQQQQQQHTGLGLGAYGQSGRAQAQVVVAGDDDADGEEEDDDDDLADLEADLEAEFEKAAGYESESDVSEED